MEISFEKRKTYCPRSIIRIANGSSDRIKYPSLHCLNGEPDIENAVVFGFVECVVTHE